MHLSLPWSVKSCLILILAFHLVAGFLSVERDSIELMFDTLASAPHREDAGLDGSAACDGYVDVMSAKAARIVGRRFGP